MKTFDDDHLPELEVILQEPRKSQTEDAEHETLKFCLVPRLMLTDQLTINLREL